MAKRAKDTISQMLLPMYSEPLYKWPKGFHNSFKSFEIVPNSWVGIDTETKGLNARHPKSFLISFAVSPRPKVSYANVIQHNTSEWDEKTKQKLISLLSDETITLVGHNIKYDLNWLRIKLGIDIKCKVFDTMFAQYMLNENQPASLGDVISNHLKEDHHKGMVSTANLEYENLQDVLLYNAKDAESVVRLLPIMLHKLDRIRVLKQTLIGMRVIKILSDIECKGVAVDVQLATKNRADLFSQCVKDRLSLREEFGSFDPDSPVELGNLLYGSLGFFCERYTESGARSTDYNTLVLLKDQADERQLEAITKIISYKKNMKLLTSLYKNIEEYSKQNGKFYPKYNLGKQYGESDGGTVTGRLSGDMQQVPRGKEHKGIFVPEDGYVFVDGDFSQLELRVVAYLAQEPVMIDAFEKGWDIHTAVMSDLLKIDYDELTKILDNSNHLNYAKYKELRVAIKRINFGIVYGVSAERLSILLKVEMGMNWSVEQCQELIDRWLAKYSAIDTFLSDVKRFVCDYKYVRSIFGQRRRLPDAMHTNYNTPREVRGLVNRAMRQAKNFVVQSTASWIMLVGMVLVDEYLQSRPELDGRMTIQVHDSGTWQISKYVMRTKKDITKVPLKWKGDVNSSVEYTSNDLNKVASDIQEIMEVKTVEFIKEYFGIEFNVPLKFETHILERWQ